MAVARERWCAESLQPTLRSPLVVWKCHLPSHAVGIALAADEEAVRAQEGPPNPVGRCLTGQVVYGTCVMFLYESGGRFVPLQESEAKTLLVQPHSVGQLLECVQGRRSISPEPRS